MAADLHITLDGTPTPVYLGENAGIASAAAARAEAAAASIRTETLNLWPDPFFGSSGGDLDAQIGGRSLYSASLANMVWDADYAHAFGTGAWILQASSSAAGGAVLWFDGKGIAEGDTLTLAARIKAEAGTAIKLTSRFVDDDGALIGSQAPMLSFEATGEVELKTMDPVTVISGAFGVALYAVDGTPAGDIALIDVLGAKGVSIEALSNIEAGQGAFANSVRAAAADATSALADASENRTRIDLVEGSGQIVDATIGTAAPADASTLGKTPTYLIDVPAAYGGYVESIVYFGRFAGAAKLKRFKEVGGDFVFQDEVAITLETGLNTLTAWTDFDGMSFDAGDYFAIFQVAGQVSVTVGTANETPYYQPTGDITTSFTPGSRFAGNKIGLGIVTKQGAPASSDGAPTSYSARLRRYRAFAATHELGATGNRYRLGLFGDSWSTSSAYFAANFAKMMVGRYGDGGVGWCGFGYTGAAPFADARGLYSVTLSGTWTTNYHAGSTSPNISDVRSSDAAGLITVANTADATHPALSAVKLHFTGTADGVIRWRWNAGAWSADTNVQGVGVQQALDLTGFPTGALSGAAAGAITLEIEVVSGSVTLGGLDLQSAADGIVIHKLGSSGSKASDWLDSDATAFETGLALLGIDGAQILFGTNEDSAGQSAATFSASYVSLVDRLLAASPACDLLLCVAPENGLVNANDVTLYAQAIAVLTAGISPQVFAAYCDLQGAFGDPANVAEYLDGGDIALFNSSDAHPNDTGALVLARELLLTWEGG